MIWIWLAVLTRLLYVGYVGLALKRQERQPTLSWNSFRRRATAVMNLDTAVFMVSVMATAGTLTWLPAQWLIGIGATLAIIGLTVKYLAFRVLGSNGYYWGDFFRGEAAPAPTVVKKGIYKYLDNPMYTVGYLPAFGWALMWLSRPGLILAVFYQIAILVFYYLVERPHFLKIYKKVEKSLI